MTAILVQNKITMKKLLLLTLLVLFSLSYGIAQSKKELRAEVDDLRQQIAQKDQELSAAKQSERISKANAAEFEAQAKELKDANATLLTNIKTLTEATAQRSDNIGRTLETIKKKEQQLNVVNDGISAYDSIAFLLLSDFKRTLGESALIDVKKDAVTVELSEVGLFGSGNTTTLIPEGNDFLSRIASAVKRHNGIEMTLLTTLPADADAKVIRDRSAAIIESFGASVAPDINRVNLKYTEGSNRSYRVRVHPNWSAFYLSVREAVKNSG